MKEKSSPPIETHPRLLSFEGIEGCGKTTQIEMLEEFLREKKLEVAVFREPGGTDFGEKLRKAVLGHNQKDRLHPLAEACLFASARAQLLHEKILPYISRKNHWAILDRYYDSSLVYQGVGGQLGLKAIEQIHQFPPLNIRPLRTYYLRIDLATSLSRQNSRGQTKDYFESRPDSFYQELISSYESLAQKNSKRICAIDASGSRDQTFSQISEDIENLISRGKASQETESEGDS